MDNRTPNPPFEDSSSLWVRVRLAFRPLLPRRPHRDQETKSPGHGFSATFADAGPFHSWFTWPGDGGNSSASESPALQKPPTVADVATVRDAIDELYDLADQYGPFDGVFGFLRSATLAAGWLMRHERRQLAGPVLDVMTPSPELARFLVLFNAYGIGIAEVEEAVMEGSGSGESSGEESSNEDDKVGGNQAGHTIAACL